MSFKHILALSLVIFFTCSKAQQVFSTTVFYEIITGENLAEINDQLTLLDKITGKEAFRGALLMKKSGLVKEAKDKLKLFKTGHKELELAIVKDSANVEFRFLRLLIQENAPKIVNYSREIKKDASYLRKNYKSLPVATQKFILKYSKSSKELKPEDFKNVGYE